MFRLGLNKGIQLGAKRGVVQAITGKRLLSSTVKRLNGVMTREEEALLNKQRSARPISPHLTIYQPQITWYMSSVHRITHLILGGTLYVLTILFGLGFFVSGINTESISQWYHKHISPLTQQVVKAGFAFTFAFHYFSTIRHYIWDFAKELTLKGVYRTGYSVLALTAIAGTYIWNM
ncbi:Succinate dehydrogenase [ubiquinone] cytochrome b subunit, mitochondrial [Nakaseomyces bracarensis]|uniref:Succinate dehydrogenase [ubiquinone] cytochrome b subunit, mitochondrial n=1 Tax=Nakaseomyces bracarensis TaxID=273131 RepID=A0ABR4NMG6_9SACH